jgi:hypothetical protein
MGKFTETMTFLTHGLTLSTKTKLDEFAFRLFRLPAYKLFGLRSKAVGDKISIEAFNQDAKRYTGFFIGEHHAISKNHSVQLEMLSILVENHGVQLVFVEMGFASGQLLNQYIQTGDKALLDVIFAKTAGTFGHTEEAYNSYLQMHEYSKIHKITLIGIDIQHHPETGMEYALSLLPHKEPDVGIADRIDDLVKLNQDKGKWNQAMLKNIVYATLEAINDNKSVFENHFGDNFFNFQFALNNIAQGFDCYAQKVITGDFYKIREAYIFSNFCQTYEQHERANFFGAWGSFHIGLNGNRLLGGKNLAQYINEDYAPLQGKIMSIETKYFNCFSIKSRKDYQPRRVRWSGGTARRSGFEGDFALYQGKKDAQYHLIIKDSPPPTRLQK